MKTILVPIDFSENADKALKYISLIAKQNTSKVILFHAYHFHASSFSESGIDNNYTIDLELRAQEEKLLKKKAEKYSKQYEIDCEAYFGDGFLVDALEKVVKKRKVDLVVMSTHGATGLEKVIFGSNTADVINNLKCPVLAVPQNVRFDGFKKIVYATDYQNKDLKSIAQLIEIAKLFKGKIDIVHVASEEKSYSEEEKLFEKFTNKIKESVSYKAINYRLLFGKNIEESLEIYIEKEKIDLICLSTKHRNLLERLFTKTSLTKKLMYHTHIPLLAFHSRG